MRTWHWYSKLALALLLAAFAYYVWPTPWRVYNRGDGEWQRVHRLTGRSEFLDDDGWKR